MHWIKTSLLLTALLALGGCAGSTAVSSGHNTALDSVDLLTMTDQMAQSIVASPAVQRAIHDEGTLRIVVDPVENEMVGEVLPRGQAEMFTARVRSLLARQDRGGFAGKFTWIMNRDAFYRLRQRELDVDLGPSPESIQPRYALMARFSSMTQEDSKHRSSYYLCVYQLTDITRRNVLWTDKYEVKKAAVKGFLD